MKDYLDREYWKWQAGDRKKNLVLFAEYLDVEYGALSAWMNGTRKPRRENVDRLAEKLGQGAYDAAGLARPDNGDIEPRMISMFTRGWKLFPPDLQRDYEEFFASATSEEVIELFKDVIKTRLARGKRSAVADDDGSDEEPAEPPKSSGRKQSRLLRRADGA